MVDEPFSCGKGVVLLNCGCSMGPLKKESMEGADSRLGCQNEKGKKEGCGTSGGTVDACGEAFQGVVVILLLPVGSRECVKSVTTSVKDS
jgi:hypothetical protein